MADSAPTSPVSPREITPRVIVLGLLLSVVMGAANVYVGLKAGMTVSASIPAAVMAMLLFRWLFRRSSILEANQVQTCASAGESLAAGIIFTMPALVLIGYWQEFDYWTVTAVAVTGGLLGILFMIPMRHVFVVGNQDLPYPEGVACAAVLAAGQEDRAQLRDFDSGTAELEGDQELADSGEAASLVAGGVLGFVFKILGGYLLLIRDSLETATTIGTRVFYFGGDLSPMLVAVGFIVRLNVASLIFIGGALGWLIGIPLLDGADPAVDSVEEAGRIWSEQIRYVGVGAMVVGGIGSLISVRAGLLAAIQQLWSGLSSGRARADDLQRDLPATALIVIGLVCTAMLAYLNFHFLNGHVGLTCLATAIMLVMGFFFAAVASYIVGLVGNSNSPVSGMTITAVLAAGGLLWLFSDSGSQTMVATLGVAAVVCCVACTSGDVCNDLKTGSIVGAAPFRQQMMQIAGVLVASLVMAPVLTLLHENTPGGIGGEQLSAPQAQLFASLASGFAGQTELPWTLIGVGAGLGVLILVIDGMLKSSGIEYRAHLMPIAVGIYLPFGLAVPILIGGLIAHLHSHGFSPARRGLALHRGVLFSSGVIAGEALTAVGLACLAAFGVMSLDVQLPAGLQTGLSLLAAVVIVVCFLWMTRPNVVRSDQ